MAEIKAKRIKNNSESLKKNFHDIYRDFFSQNPIVMSSSGAFYFTGEHIVNYGGMAILQKLPLKVYVGLEGMEAGKFEIGSYKSFDIERMIWEDVEMSPIMEEKISKLILKELEKTGSKKGYRCNILSEVPVKCGLNSTGALSSALTAAIYMDNGLIFKEDIKSFEKQSLAELSKNKKFDKIFRFAWKLNAANVNASSGTGSFISMISSNYPVVYFPEKRDGDNLKSSTRIPLFIDENYDLIDKIKYWAFRINELLGTKADFTWPVDFGLIYSGNIKSTEIVIRSMKNVQELIESNVAFGRSTFKNIFKKGDSDYVFFYDCLFNKDRSYWKKMLQMANEISLECLFSLSNLLRKRIDTTNFKNLFRSINRYHNVMQYLRVSTPSINKIQSYIDYRAASIDPATGGAAKLSGSGKGGEVLFIVPYGHLSGIIDDIVEHLKKELDRHVYLDYASWIDGTESRGLEIDQHLEGKVYSSYVSRGSVILENFENGGQFTEILSLEDFEKSKKEADILLDTVNDDIYIGGDLLDSKEIHSAVATIKVLVKLLENRGRGIGNKELGFSSYTEDRSGFQSKIITPLKKAFKNHRKKDMDINITGGLVDFRIKLDIDDLKIAVIKKII